ncbi:MAG: VCBS repeat-containing protein, partial [Thermoplasmata archaeon]|nr:VCBS repeat-containing protein [Thermoplasmata archaeon]
MMRISSRSIVFASILLILLCVPIPEAGGEDAVTGRLQISGGLPQETASFTTVEVFDSDHNGLDEIFMGGAGFVESQARTEGIRAYEYDSSQGSWREFGTGLPGDGSGEYYGAIGLGDINGDGEMDIAAPKPSRWYDIDTAENGIDIYTGNGSGNFEFLHTISLPDTYLGSSNEAEIYDLDGDGHGDIIASTYRGVKIWFGDGTGTSWDDRSPILVISGNLEVGGVGIGDLNNDGLLDVVATPYQGSTNVMMYIQGASRSWNQVDFKETDNGFGVKVQDLDGDGNNDVVYGTRTEGIRAWLGEGTTNLQGFPCTDASTGLPDTGGDYDQVELGDV